MKQVNLSSNARFFVNEDGSGFIEVEIVNGPINIFNFSKENLIDIRSIIPHETVQPKAEMFREYESD